MPEFLLNKSFSSDGLTVLSTNLLLSVNRKKLLDWPEPVWKFLIAWLLFRGEKAFKTSSLETPKALRMLWKIFGAHSVTWISKLLSYFTV